MNDQSAEEASPTIVDCWFNVNETGLSPDFWGGAKGSVAKLFHRQREMLDRGETRADLVALMDDLGISRALITAFPDDTFADFDREVEMLAGIAADYPGRFGVAPHLPLELGMVGARAVRRAAQEFGAAAVRIMPSRVGLPPNDRAYYPVYTRCVDEGIPITINVGLPGPALPASTQQPIHLDDVCRDFPDLVVVATHMGWPWQNELIGLIQRHPNLYAMTSAWAPAHYPPEMVAFLKGRGTGRIMFASDHPLVDARRALRELEAFGLGGEAATEFFSGVADRLFFDRESPRP